MIRHLSDVHNISGTHGKSAAVGSMSTGRASAAEDGLLRPNIDFSGAHRQRNLARISSQARSDLNEDLLMWLAMDALPFSIVGNDGFQLMFKRQFPDCNLPSSDSLRLTALPKVYNDTKRAVL